MFYLLSLSLLYNVPDQQVAFRFSIRSDYFPVSYSNENAFIRNSLFCE